MGEGQEQNGEIASPTRVGTRWWKSCGDEVTGAPCSQGIRQQPFAKASLAQSKLLV